MATRWRYAVVVTLCLVTLPLSTQAQETSLVPVLVDGETVRLAMRIYKPVAGNPAPTLVFNHGSTGMGTDRPFLSTDRRAGGGPFFRPAGMGGGDARPTRARRV